MLPMMKKYILNTIDKYRHYYKYKRIAIIIISVWFISTIILGIIFGFRNRAKAIVISPEYENDMIMNKIEANKSKIGSGVMLSTKDNLSFFEIQQSKNYLEKLKSEERKGE